MKRSHRAALATSALALASGAAASETITYNYDALGRLVTVKHGGTINAGQAHSICYDRAGNREIYKSSSTGALATCPTPTPTPTPTPGNSVPIAGRDAATLGVFCTGVAVAVLTNDDDADGHALTVTSATGDTYVTALVGGTNKNVELSAGYRATTSPSVVSYTISDSHGGTATGYIDVTITAANSCQSSTTSTDSTNSTEEPLAEPLTEEPAAEPTPTPSAATPEEPAGEPTPTPEAPADDTSAGTPDPAEAPTQGATE